jgi:hypothetical protein
MSSQRTLPSEDKLNLFGKTHLKKVNISSKIVLIAVVIGLAVILHQEGNAQNR